MKRPYVCTSCLSWQEVVGDSDDAEKIAEIISQQCREHVNGDAINLETFMYLCRGFLPAALQSAQLGISRLRKITSRFIVDPILTR
jgi:hypothetical protein